ncbi:MAG: hypothetical protein ACI4AQ_04955 [Lachnospiraceae bacterium]
MKRKVLSLMLMLAMVLSLAACGSKTTNSSKTVLENMLKVQSKSFDCEVVLNVDEENISFRINGGIVDDQNAAFTIDAKMNLPEDELVVEEYVPLTDIYVVNGNEYYFNVTAIFDFLTELDPSVAMIQSYLGLSGDYFVITAAELADFMNTYGETGEVFTEEDFLMSGMNETGEPDKELLDLLAKFIDEFAEKAGNDAVVIANDKISIKINDSNLEKVMEAFSNMDIEDYCMKIAERLDKIQGGLAYTAAMKDEVEGLNDSLKQAVEEYKATGSADLGKFNVVADMGVKDGNVVMSVVMDVESEGEAVNATINYNFSSEAEPAFETPTSTFDYDELMDIVNQLGGM